MNSILIKSMVFAVLGGGTAWFSLSSGSPTAGAEAGLIMSLPAEVGEWRGEPGEPSEAERTILPPDTEFAKMNYRHSSIPSQINASIVLSGKDRTSIHRPEVCLAGQGWNVRSSNQRTVDLADGRKLGVNCLSISREITLANGKQKTAEAFYVYWFVGSRTTTPDNLERILSTAKDNVLHGDNPRWAYVSLLSVVTGSLAPGGSDAETTLTGVDGWIANAAPEFQRIFEPVRFF